MKKIFVLSVILVLLFCSCTGKGACGEKNVILITVDTLRADHLGCYGYSRDTSPFLDKLAKDGVLFRDAVVQWPKTWPSLASLLTSTYPATNGIYHHPRIMTPSSLVFISEVLKANDYETFAVVSNYNVGKVFGFNQGFDLFVESWMEEFTRQTGRRDFVNSPGAVKQYTNATIVTKQTITAMESRSRKKNFFLWAHYMDPHGPYVPPKSYNEFFTGWKAGDPVPVAKIPPYQRQLEGHDTIVDPEYYKVQYDREIRYFDDELKTLVAYLHKEGLYDRTIIVITADHGESLGDHGYFFDHGKLPYESGSHVPLLVIAPQLSSKGRFVETPVGLIDVVPTLCDLLGIPKRKEFEGTSFLPLLTSGKSVEQKPIFTMAGENFPFQRVIRWGPWKLVHVLSEVDRSLMTGQEYELYNLADDPGETQNLIDTFPEQAGRLKSALLSWDKNQEKEKVTQDEKIQHDKFSIDMLKSLGYVQ